MLAVRRARTALSLTSKRTAARQSRSRATWPRPPMRRLFAETKEAFDALDVLGNNAGVYKFLSLEEITEDEFHREFNINVRGTILATKEAVRHPGPNGGSIIN